MTDSDRIGRRIAALRQLRGLTQQGLATRANVSLSALSKVESGARPATPALIGAVAQAMQIDVPRITGQPYDDTGTGRTSHLKETAAQLRRTISTMDYPDDTIPPRPAADLAADVAHVSAHGMRGDYVAIGRSLPTLLEELAIAIAAAPDDDKAHLRSLLAEAYSGASAISNVLGYLDLRDRVIDRISAAAGACDDPLRTPRVTWQRSQSLMSVAAYDEALTALEHARAALGDDPARMDDPTRSVYGSLHLRSAVVNARAGRESAAWDHMAAAADAAELVPADRNDYGLSFNSANVAQHNVSVALDLEQSATAVRLGREVRLPRSVPAVRVGHHWIDMARAYLMEGDIPTALRCLDLARRAAPQQARHHPMVRETVMGIAESGRHIDGLSPYATWLGIG